MHALIADDARAMRRILSGILTEQGFEVAEAENGSDAVSALSAGQDYELICLDYNMPDMKGDEVLKKLRADDRLADSKVIVITTEADRSMVNYFFELGANEYVFKPFNKDAIKAKLQSLGLIE